MTTTSRWLDVEVSDDIDLNTLSSNLALVDLQNEREYKLLVGDFGKGDEKPKLKVFRGIIQLADVLLPDLPLGVVGFYTSDTSPKSIPVVAVAFSCCLYIYRNLKMYYKYHVPRVDVCEEEMGVWRQLTDPTNRTPENVASFVNNLKGIQSSILTEQTKQFLQLGPSEQLEYLEQNPKLPSPMPSELTCMTTLKMHSADKYSTSCLIVATEDSDVIILDPQENINPKLPSPMPSELTCMATLKMHSADKYSTSCLIVATEDSDVIILDPQTFLPMQQAKLCEIKRTPYQMVATGMYIVDYRIVIATREKSVCLLKRGWSQGKILFNTEEHIIAIEAMSTDNSILVICTDNTFTCYNKKGLKSWTIPLDHRPVAMTLLPITHLGMTLVGVALASGHVHFYDEKALVDTMFVRDVVSVMKFGQLGREEHVLLIVTANGNLMLKILKRTAEFSVHATGVDCSSVAVHHQTRPWLLPKRSKLFLEQSMRERENATAMHQVFQQELNRLRLSAAQTLLEAYTKSDNSVALGALEPIRLSAEVEGLGPVFKMTLMVENTSKDKAVVGLSILFHLHNASYKVYNPYIKVPLLSPGNSLKFPTKVEEIFQDLNPDVYFRTVTGQGGERSLVKVLLLKEGRQAPVLAATVQMPPTDPLFMPVERDDDYVENFA